MEFKDVILNRKSVRKFTDRDVTGEQIHALLEWAHAAPSAGNLRPWRFVVIRNQNRREQVVETTFSGNRETVRAPQKWILTAPVLIAVCADLQAIGARYGECELCESLRYLDCSAAIENILLGAVNLGLSSCYVSGFHVEELSRALELPEHVVPIALLPIGYAASATPGRQRGPLKDYVFYESYGNINE